MSQLISTDEALRFFEQRHNIDILPYAIITDSGVPGPHMVIVGATHGNETVGVKAILDYITYLEQNNLQLKHGKITWIMGNVEGFRQNRRFIDTNMNRAYSHELGSSYEHQRIAQIRSYFSRETVSKPLALLLDLHSVSVGDFKIAVCLSDHEENYAKLDTFTSLERRFTLNTGQLPGSLLQEAHRYGAFGVALECGNYQDPKSAHTALWHINKIIKEYKLLNDEDVLPIREIEKPHSITKFTCVEPIIPGVSFEWELPDESIYTGSKLTSQMVYATNQKGKLVAPQDCVLFIPDKHPHPNDYDAGFLATVSVSEVV